VESAVLKIKNQSAIRLADKNCGSPPCRADLLNFAFCSLIAAKTTDYTDFISNSENPCNPWLNKLFDFFRREIM